MLICVERKLMFRVQVQVQVLYLSTKANAHYHIQLNAVCVCVNNIIFLFVQKVHTYYRHVWGTMVNVCVSELSCSSGDVFNSPPIISTFICFQFKV